VESHSDHVLNAVRLAVRNKLLKSSDVAIHYFTHGGPDSAHTTVETPELDEEGRIKQWPQGFFDESDKALEALILPPENET
jgi:predicted ATPase